MLPRRANPKCFAKTLATLVFVVAFGGPLPSAADEAALLQTPSIEDLIVQRDTKSGSLGFDLDRREWGSLAPGAINFTVRSSGQQDVSGRTMESYSPHAADDERSLTYTISAGWGTPDDRITFSFTTRNSDGGGTSLFVSDPQEDILSLSRSMMHNGWATNFTASLGNSRPDAFGGRTQKLGASASFLKTTDWARGMGITAKIYQGLHTAPGHINRENDTNWELRTGGDLLFGRAKNANSALPSLSIFFSVKGNTPDQKDADIGDVDVTTGVAGKLTF